MKKAQKSRMPAIVAQYENEILADWVDQQISSPTYRSDLIRENELRQQSRQFLAQFRTAVQSGAVSETADAAWSDVRAFLAEISRSRALQGFSPSETATFVFSLKRPLFSVLQREIGNDVDALQAELWAVTTTVDELGIFTMEVHRKTREDVIARQQEEMMELSTPVVQLWQGVLAVPLIGTLDSARTQVVMENLLQRIVETSADIAIIDITGVPTVDTLVAQHLLKTVAAARLMGADCIVSGIRPQIAQTIVHLGVELTEVATKASLADAFALALRRSGLVISRAEAAGTRG